MPLYVHTYTNTQTYGLTHVTNIRLHRSSTWQTSSVHFMPAKLHAYPYMRIYTHTHTFFTQIKYLADPSMHSMPAVAMNPTNSVWVGQSQDNQVCSVYEQKSLSKFKRCQGTLPGSSFLLIELCVELEAALSMMGWQENNSVVTWCVICCVEPCSSSLCV